MAFSCINKFGMILRSEFSHACEIIIFFANLISQYMLYVYKNI